MCSAILLILAGLFLGFTLGFIIGRAYEAEHQSWSK